MLRCFVIFLIARPSIKAEPVCSPGDETCTASKAQISDAVLEGHVKSILKRCDRKGNDCGIHLEKTFKPFMKRCAVEEDLDADDQRECLYALQEILVLTSCSRKDAVNLTSKDVKVTKKNCRELLDLLVINEPVEAAVIATLSTVQWQRLFMKAADYKFAMENAYNGTTFYMNPQWNIHNATYGRIAFGHRITLEDIKTNRFAGGMSTPEAHDVLHSDYLLATQIAQSEIGGEMDYMPLKYQAVAVDLAFVYGSTQNHTDVIEALLNKNNSLEAVNRKHIKKALLKKPVVWRHELLWHEFIKS